MLAGAGLHDDLVFGGELLDGFGRGGDAGFPWPCFGRYAYSHGKSPGLINCLESTM